MKELIEIIKHCLQENGTQCTDCIKGKEERVVLTCRALLEKIVEEYEKGDE